jgi:hypothetical protein
MSTANQDIQQVEEVLGRREFVSALQNRLFRRFLEGIPLAIAISKLSPVEKIV